MVCWFLSYLYILDEGVGWERGWGGDEAEGITCRDCGGGCVRDAREEKLEELDGGDFRWTP